MSATDTEIETRRPDPDRDDVDQAATDADAHPSDGDVTSAADEPSPSDPTEEPRQQRFSWSSVLVYGLLPLIVVLLAGAAGYLKYRDVAAHGAETARAESVQAATEATVAMLSYSPQNVETTLHGAEDRLTGQFQDSYRSLINDVVIPGAKQKAIAANAAVPAAASISATNDHATVMVFVNQSIIVGADAPTDTASAVEVTLDKVGQRWLVSGFEPK